MKNIIIPKFEQFVNESLDPINEAKIAAKDWDRMLKLVMKGDDGETAAKLITKKDKAIARFISGLKLNNSPLKHDKIMRYGYSSFSALGNKALELGATPEEIQTLYDTTDVPSKYTEKMTSLGGKKLRDRFVGDISQAVLDSGFDINYLPHNGYALTNDGKDAMNRSGRKWTIGYKSEIDLGDRKASFVFDAITDEGDGPTKYVLSYSDPIFNRLNYKVYGKQKWISILKEILKEIKQ